MRSSLISLLVRARAGALQAQTWAKHPTSSSSASWLPAVSSSKYISTTSSVNAPVAQVAVNGDVDAFVRDVDAVISNDTCNAKDVADAALALTYIQVKGNRRIWGKVLEKASSLKATFDPATLSSFLWSVATSNVSHFKTVFELCGPAQSLLASFNPTQLSFVIEAMGKAGVTDVEMFKQVSARVTGAMPWSWGFVSTFLVRPAAVQKSPCVAVPRF